MPRRSSLWTLVFTFLALLFVGRADAQNLAQAPIWGVTCAGTSAGLDCRAVQSVPMTNTSQASIAVQIPADTKKPLMLILVPTGIYLPDGVTLGFGGEFRKVPLHNCDGTGCLAKYGPTDAEVAAMAKGVPVTISVKDANEQPISIQVPTIGFSAAYAKIK